jgi:hypothetical protein
MSETPKPYVKFTDGSYLTFDGSNWSFFDKNGTQRRGTKAGAPGGVSTITVGASVFNYTNNDGIDEMVYITGGTVSVIAKNGITIYTATNAAVFLLPGESINVTYSVLPTMNKDTR